MRKETLKSQVLSIMKNNESTRNCDIKLTIMVWKTYYPEYIREIFNGDEVVPLHSLFLLPREDNIKRIRAKIQKEESRFLPTDPIVRKRRSIKEEEWRKFLGYK